MHVIKQIKPNKHNAGVKLTVGQWTRPAKFHILSIQDSVIIEMSGHFSLEQLEMSLLEIT